MTKSNRLIKNTVIIAIGSIGSKFLQFLLLPFYTHVLSTEQYGTVDLIMNISMLLVPILSINIFDAVFRYAMDESVDNRDVFSIGFYISLFGLIVMFPIASVLSWLRIYDQYIWLIVFYSFSNILRSTISQFIKAIGETKLFTVDNLFQTSMILVTNIVFLAVFRWGVIGYILAYILANFLSALFLFCYLKLWSYLKIRSIGKSVLKTMLLFSIPLIPNTICWWISNFSDRFMVTNMLGVEANGIYAISYKVPSILVIVVNVFLQAWQISANEEFNDTGRNHFYTSVFNALQAFVFMICSGLMLCSKLITAVMTSREFYGAWKYMPVLLLGISFFTFGQFLGSVYTANKKTTMAFVTNLAAAVVNVTLNLFLIQWWGVLGAAIATTISYLIFWLFRLIDVGRIVKIKYHPLTLAAQCLLLLTQALIVTFEVGHWIIYAVACCATIVLVNFKFIRKMYRKLRTRMVKQK